MPTIQENILEAFYKKLGQSEEFNEDVIQELRRLFEKEKKPKADKVVGVLASALREKSK